MLRAVRAVSVTVVAFGALLVAPGPIGAAADAGGAGAVRVTLVSAGSSPRSPLRMTLTEGDVATREMEFVQTVEQSIDGTPTTAVNAPPIRMTMEMTVGSVADDGVAQLSYVYTDVTVADDGSLGAAEIAQLESTLEPLTSLSGTQTLTARNQVLDAELDGLDAFDAALAGSMRQLTDQAGSLAVPFPKEAVGVGARWRGVSSLRLSGIDVKQSYVYTLKERDADGVVIEVRYVQTAPRQRAELPAIPEGSTVEITKFRIVGSGEATLDLGESMPTASAVHASGRQVFFVRSEGDSGELSQTLELDVTLETPLLDRKSG